LQDSLKLAQGKAWSHVTCFVDAKRYAGDAEQ
jgi:hypothetical protein